MLKNRKIHINKNTYNVRRFTGPFLLIFTKLLTIIAADGTFKLLLTNLLDFWQFFDNWLDQK